MIDSSSIVRRLRDVMTHSASLIDGGRSIGLASGLIRASIPGPISNADPPIARHGPVHSPFTSAGTYDRHLKAAPRELSTLTSVDFPSPTLPLMMMFGSEMIPALYRSNGLYTKALPPSRFRPTRVPLVPSPGSAKNGYDSPRIPESARCDGAMNERGVRSAAGPFSPASGRKSGDLHAAFSCSATRARSAASRLCASTNR